MHFYTHDCVNDTHCDTLTLSFHRHMHQSHTSILPKPKRRYSCKQKPYQAQDKHEEDTLIVYYRDDFPTPFAKRIISRHVSLAEFKTKVLMKTGKYRWEFGMCNLTGSCIWRGWWWHKVSLVPSLPYPMHVRRGSLVYNYPNHEHGAGQCTKAGSRGG